MEIEKSKRHNRFLIKDCILYEVINSMLGGYKIEICQVLYPDCDRLTDEQVNEINKLIE